MLFSQYRYGIPNGTQAKPLGALNLRVPAAPLLTDLAYRKHILRF
jgi:hypothetical protein